MLKKTLLILISFASLDLAFGDEPCPGKAVASANTGPIALEYKLTGITKLGGVNKVFLVRHQADGTDLQIHLKQGERFEDLEVLDVNFKLRTVRVRYRGAEGAMNFKSHGIKAIITTVEEQGDEFVRVHKKFAEEHKRAHEERYRRPPAPQTTESVPNSPTNSQRSSSSP